MTALPALGLLARLTSGRGRRARHPGGQEQPLVPPDLATPLGCDAVGVPERLGPRVLDLLPRAGHVLAAGGHWWWLVPADSDAGLAWPPGATYAAGPDAPRADHGDARLVHDPVDAVPYTHPLLLYIAVCAATGTAPAWEVPR
ncbi:hypothetical protein GCM10027168_31600 [Streptomyces capparidis]